MAQVAPALAALAGTRSKYFNRDGLPVAVAVWCGSLVAGLHLAIFYTSDPAYWHERILLWPADAGESPRSWYVLSPDGDVYAEATMAGLGWGSRFVTLDGTGQNAMIPPGSLYAFGVLPTDDILRGHIEDAMEETTAAGIIVASPADLKYLRRGGQEVPLSDLVRLPAPLADDAPPDGDGAEHGGGLGGRGTATPSLLHLPDPGYAWFSLESVPGEISRDDEVTLDETALIRGDRAIHTLPSGKHIAARLVALPLEPRLDDTGLGDARTLGPLRYDS